jgi:hypothetical protein
MKFILGTVLSLITINAFAQVASTNADQFAIEAGAIAGAVQSCGNDITEYNRRVNDAINVLGANASDREQAMTFYEKALTDIQANQAKLHNLNCGQVIQSFNSLPLMQPDYKTSVLPALAKMNTASASTPLPPTTTTNGQ